MNRLIDVVLKQDLDPNDPNCLDPEFIRRYALPAFAALSRYYFRIEHEGTENLPRKGPMMVVCNHNGGPILPDCWIMLAWYWSHFGFERPGYAMVHDIPFRIPFVKNFLLKIGALRASPSNAHKVLDRGGVLLVFPGGELECLRSYWRRNVIDFFGRTGFIKLAMKRGVPIVPVVNIGGHETLFTLHSSQALARWSGLQKLTRVKTVPINLGLPWGIWATGFLPFIPLPAKFSYKVGKPFYFLRDRKLHENEKVVRRAYHAIVDSMQDMLDELASRRRFPVIG